MSAKQVIVKRTRTRTRKPKNQGKNASKKGRKRCPTCGRYL